MSSFKLFLFGSPRLERDGEPLKIEARKNMALLAYLALTGRGSRRASCSRESLVALLWPDLEPSKARAGLRRNLSTLKKALGGEWLIIDRQTVGLDDNADSWIDIDEFHHLLQTDQKHSHSKTDICPDCLTALAEAVELYRGDFLAGFTLRDSPDFDEWQFFQTESFRQELAAALQRLVAGYSEQGEYKNAIPYARRWLALDSLYEPVHRQLMQLYAQTGQSSAALGQYQECVRILEEELGVSPQPETTALYEHIRAGKTGYAEPLSVAPLPPTPRHTLPASLTPFIGRQTELVRIKEYLQDPACRLLTLVGSGGIGKTRLALEAAATQLNHFAHGVFFVSLASLQTAEAIVPTVAKALGFSFYDQESPRQQLLDYLRQKNLLLLMDNFEHLLPSENEMNGGAELVVDMLRAVPDLKILTTSRARLNVQGEHLFYVEGMDYPDENIAKQLVLNSPPDAMQYSAIKLFRQSARRVQADFELTTDNLPDVIHICGLVEGIPLAVLLAASWVEMFTPIEIAEEIKQSIDFLAADWHDVPERQRSLRAVFDQSWRLLTEQEQEVLQALSVFSGGFTREAAQRVTGTSLRILMGLVNKSLLQRVSAGRYGMHELLRQYAAEKLEVAGKADTVCDAHSAYYAEFVQQHGVDFLGRKQPGSLDKFEANFENVCAAWNWSVQQKTHYAISLMAVKLGFFCYVRRLQEGRNIFRLAREQLTPAPGDEPHPAWGQVLVVESYFYKVSKAQLEKGLLIAQKYGNPKEIAFALWTLGNAALEADDHATALSFFEKSLLRYGDLDTNSNIAGVLIQLTEAYRLSGQFKKAIELSRQGLDLSRKIGNKYWVGRALTNTGVIALYTGNFAEAEGHLQEANAISLELGFNEGIASSSMELGKLAFLRKDFAEAKALAAEALAIATDIGLKRVAHSVRFLNSAVAAALGEEVDELPKEQKPAPLTDVPSTIDQFEVKKLIGAGSMGSVFQAYDPDNRYEVAIKIANPEALKKFEWASRVFNRETEMMTKLSAHSAFAEFYGSGATADSPYIVLEYIEGKDLEELLEEYEGFLPEKLVIRWALQICDALMYVHNQEPEPIIFRDIKLSNVMIDPNNKVRLIDLGIAEDYRPGRELPMLGTEGYSPPEQYIGYSDARSDIYALGATLHHLLTRRDPRQERPFSFHDAPPRSLNPAISEMLETVIKKATEYKAEDRYQSAAEMKVALSVLAT